MEPTKRYRAEGTETGTAFWIVDTLHKKNVGLLDSTSRESINLVIDALNQRATFDQAREALKHLALYPQDRHARLLIEQTLAAMEGQP